jgi:hypothetical protein
LGSGGHFHSNRKIQNEGFEKSPCGLPLLMLIPL